MWLKFMDSKKPSIIFIILIVLFVILFAVFVCAAITERCSEQISMLAQFFTMVRTLATLLAAIVAVYAVISTYKVWKNERILELQKEYDQLAKSRRIFWDNLNEAYKVLRELHSEFAVTKCDQISEADWARTEGKAVELIRCAKDVYPPFDPRNIEDKEEKDLLYWADKIKNGLKCKDQKAILGFAEFIYPDPKGNYRNFIYLSKSGFRKISFDNERGRLSRFWNKWASSTYSENYLLDNYISAREQLIMLTWLELALVRQVGEHGKGKVKLFEIAEKIDQEYKQKQGLRGEKRSFSISSLILH